MMSDVPVIDEVSAERIRCHVEKIVREIPHRAAGSANGKRMAEYSHAAMSEIGLTDVAIHELQAIVSFPEHADFRVEAPVKDQLRSEHARAQPQDRAGRNSVASSSMSAAARYRTTPARTRAAK